MYEKYWVGASVTNTANTVLINTNNAGATLKHAWLDIILGGGAVTPADNSARVLILRTSTAGTTPTGTITPSPLDPTDDAATTAAYNGTYGAAPTTGVQLLTLPINQRVTVRWIAAPGEEIWSPVTANAGLCLNVPTSGIGGSAWAMDMSVIFQE